MALYFSIQIALYGIVCLEKNLMSGIPKTSYFRHFMSGIPKRSSDTSCLESGYVRYSRNIEASAAVLLEILRGILSRY